MTVVAVAVLAATLSGCAGPAPLGSTSTASTTATARSEGSPLATFKAKGFARLDARTEGIVAIHNGCLVLTTGNRAEVPLFPDTDVTWHNGVLTHEGIEYSVGDRIVLGGGGTESTLGEVIEARIKSSGVDEITAPEGCNDFPVWLA